MGDLASVPVGVGAPVVLKIPLTSPLIYGTPELDLTTVTSLRIVVGIPNGPQGSIGSTMQWSGVPIATVPPYGPATPTKAYGLYAFTGTEFIFSSVDLPGQYRLHVYMQVPGGEIPEDEWRSLEVTSRVNG